MMRNSRYIIHPVMDDEEEKNEKEEKEEIC